MDDPFEQSPGGYSVDNFYTNSTDGKGHKDGVKIWVPPRVYGELAALVSEKNFPAYKTPNDITRDALVHRLHYLNHTKIHSPRLDKLIALEVMYSEVSRELEYHDGLRDGQRAAFELARHDPKRMSEIVKKALAAVGRDDADLDEFKRLL